MPLPEIFACFRFCYFGVAVGKTENAFVCLALFWEEIFLYNVKELCRSRMFNCSAINVEKPSCTARGTQFSCRN